MNLKCSQFLSFAFLSLLLCGPLNAIECKKASTPAEKTICNSKTLINYDAAMSKVYSLILNNLNADKKKFIENQKSWIKERDKLDDEDELLDLYAQKTRSQCNTHTAVCKSYTLEILKNWKEDSQTLKDEDSILIASYFKGNLKQYVDDKQGLNELEGDIELNHGAPLDFVVLHKLDNSHLLLTIPLFMGAYQGPSISFLYDNRDLHIVRFPFFNEKLTYPFTHSNYINWDKDVLVIQNRSRGSLYECGTTQYLKFDKNTFVLIKQVDVPCSDKEMEEISNGKLTPEGIKRITVYLKQRT